MRTREERGRERENEGWRMNDEGWKGKEKEEVGMGGKREEQGRKTGGERRGVEWRRDRHPLASPLWVQDQHVPQRGRGMGLGPLGISSLPSPPRTCVYLWGPCTGCMLKRLSSDSSKPAATEGWGIRRRDTSGPGFRALGFRGLGVQGFRVLGLFHFYLMLSGSGLLGFRGLGLNAVGSLPFKGFLWVRNVDVSVVKTVKDPRRQRLSGGQLLYQTSFLRS